MNTGAQRANLVSGHSNARLQTPVLLLIFNRPQTTRVVMERIRSARPRALYVAADGPRADRAGEVGQCEEARRIATKVDWECEVRTLFRDSNAGCGPGVSAGITWFFGNEPEGIVLEDDCVPNESFFRFCSELLEHYRDDARIMHISGNSFQLGRRRGKASYYFSEYPNIWGWASWRRAWKHYDFDLRPAWELQDTWDTQWHLSVGQQGGLSIVPNANLVTNIGFGQEATHTRGSEHLANLATEEIQFPLVHPRTARADKPADIFNYYVHHRLVRHPHLIWPYWLRDYLIARLKPIKRRLLGPHS